MRTLLAALFLLLLNNATADTYLLHNVHLLPMDRETVIEDQALIIHNGVVRTIGQLADLATDQPGLKMIDGGGGYLMPGLAEMHAHVPGRNHGDQYVQDLLNLYLANGITTIRGMLGQSWHLELRDMLANGDWTGPRLITSGPSFNGRSVSSPEQAAEMARQQAAAGYDFLKLHPGLNKDEYLAIINVHKQTGIPFAGHVSAAVGLPFTLSAGRQASIDHLDGYAQEMVPDDHPLHGEAPQFFGLNLAPGFDLQVVLDTTSCERFGSISRLACDTAGAGVWNVPTQSLMENAVLRDIDEMLARPEMEYVRPETRQRWAAAVRNYHAAVDQLYEASDPAEAAAHKLKFINGRRQLILSLQQNGAGLLLGSDAPQVMNVPGFSIHEELAYLVAAGLTPYEVLRSGTANVARFFDQENAGMIRPGDRADLVLLAKNPLQDIAATRTVKGVMQAGRWYDEAWLKKTLAGIRERKI